MSVDLELRPITKHALKRHYRISDPRRHRVLMQRTGDDLLGGCDSHRATEFDDPAHPRKRVEIHDAEVGEDVSEHVSHVELEPALAGKPDDQASVLEVRGERREVAPVEEGREGEDDDVAAPRRLFGVARHRERVGGEGHTLVIAVTCDDGQPLASEDVCPDAGLQPVLREHRQLDAVAGRQHSGERVRCRARAAENYSKTLH